MVSGCIEDRDRGAGEGAREPGVARAPGVGAHGGPTAVVAPALRKGHAEPRALLTAIGEIWARGVSVNWRAVFDGTGAERVALPKYAFQRERYWLAPTAGKRDAGAIGQVPIEHPLLGAAVAPAEGEGWLFTGRISLDTHPWLSDHVVAGTALLPGTALLELALYAGAQLGCEAVRELVLESPLAIGEGEALQLQLTIGDPDPHGARAIAIYSRPEGELTDEPWTRHASGTVIPSEHDSVNRVIVAELAGEWPPSGAVEIEVEQLHDALAAAGIEYGPAFQGLRAVWRRGAEVFAEATLPQGLGDETAQFALHPALLDATLQAVAAIERDQAPTARLPFTWNGVNLYASGATSLRAHLRPVGEDGVTLTVADEHGDTVASVDSLILRAASTNAGYDRDSLFDLEWVAAGTGGEDVDRDGLGRVLDCTGGATTAEDALARVGDALAAVQCELADEGARELADDGSPMPTPTPAPTAIPAPALPLAVVTRGAVSLGGKGVTDPAGGGVWGLVRAAQAEHPGRFVLIDVDGEATADAIAPALALGEPEVAVRAGELFVPRLVRASRSGEGRLAVGSGSWRLGVNGAGGALEDLEVIEDRSGERLLGAGEVRVAVRAAGVNFRDVLMVLGMYPGEMAIGGEGAGVVLEVGCDVTELAIGDRVMGLLDGAFGAVAVTDRRLLVRIPEGWSLVEAAAAPVAFLTAYHGLVDLAGARRGERVLVHAAAGGVGIAALQLARHLGLEVLATASEPKWGALEAMGVAREQIASSRDLEFGERFASAGGVDIVLNALAGEYVDTSAALLSTGGRFLEMGKTDIREPAEIESRFPGVSYRAFDMMEAGPDRIQEMLKELRALFEEGALEGLPVRVWDTAEAVGALRYMSQARHVGKNVLRHPAPPLRGEGTVLITGGTGGLGALVARHLVERHGVRHLLLASRSGPGAEGAGELVAELEELGASVRVAACDVAEREQVEALLEGIDAEHPLCAVLHAAAVLDDGLLDGLTPERLHAVLAPKALGAWHLHELTAGLDLRAFVLFSSAAGTLGSAGQAAYAAANGLLDALAGYRRAQGLSGSSLAWGPWTQAGMAERLGEGERERLARAGIRALSPAQGLGLLDAAFELDRPLLLPVGLDVATLRGFARAGQLGPLLGELVHTPSGRTAGRGANSRAGGRGMSSRAGGRGALAGGRGTLAGGRGSPAGRGGLATKLAELDREERERLVLELVREHAAAVLGHASAEAIAAGQAFKDLGFDSLGAVELRNRLAAECDVQLPATAVFDHPTPQALAAFLVDAVLDTHRQAAPLRARATVATGEPIAIVGMSCRYPGWAGSGPAGAHPGTGSVRSPEQLWELVAGGGDAIGPFPDDRGWDLDALYDPDPRRPGSSYVREGGFLAGAGEFDAAFFGVSPREALAMDPQQRLLLELCWEAIERAGIDPVTLRGSETGVFAGVGSSSYGDGATGGEEGVEGYLLTGSIASVASGRVAYTFGLEGPAVSVDTACSSSLVALHLAANALRQGECTLALAGGVTVMATPGLFVEFSRQRGLAPDGRCKSFGDDADGTSWSEGAGIVLLERLSDAQRAGHRILGVLRGSAINQDGASNGLTAPNGPSQQRVIMQALANAGLAPEEVDAVEAHGTGTTLGDPIEAQALLATYGQNRPAEAPLWLGSIKSNIGHAAAASGVAGVIKMVMALRHERLPRTLHAERPTTQVDWSAGAVELLREERPWPRNGRLRRAGVSSFGISGTNAHLVLEEAPPQPAPVGWDRPERDGAEGAIPAQLSDGAEGVTTAPPPFAPSFTALPWLISGRGGEGLNAQARRLSEHLAAVPKLDPADVALALAGRPRLENRGVVLGGSEEQLREGLVELAEDRTSKDVVRGIAGEGRLAFLFTGQGAQRVGMGRDLYRTFPVFAAAFDEVCAHLDEHLECSLQAVVFAEEASDAAAGAGGGELDQTALDQTALDQTALAQPALFALEVALYRLVEAWGVRPDFLIGHSVGELAAAHVAGVFGLEDACRLVAARGRLMGALPKGGAMVAIAAEEREALESLTGFEGQVSLAAVNGPSSVVLSGDEDAVLELAGIWEERGRRVKRLRVSHAFHSSRMDGMLEAFERVAEGVSFGEPSIPLISNVSGGLASGEELCSAGYWVRHVREAVRFVDGVRWLHEEGVRSFLELGPDGVLSAMAHECVGGDVSAAPVLRPGQPEIRALLAGLAGAWVRGAEIDWARAFDGTDASPVELPAYAFQRERFWLRPGRPAGDVTAIGQAPAGHPLLGAAVALADGERWLFTGRLSLETHPWLAEHAVAGVALLPGTALLELALHAGAQLGCGLVRELTLQAPLALREGEAIQIQLAVGELEDPVSPTRTIGIYSRPAQDVIAGAPEPAPWVRHAEGLLATDAVHDAGAVGAMDAAHDAGMAGATEGAHDGHRA